MWLRGIASLYGPGLPAALVTRLRTFGYSPFKLLSWFWQAKTYSAPARPNEVEQPFIVFLWLGIVAQIGFGVALLVEWA
ncbi:MAG TPA: hypothetical protein VFH39_03345, partial [Candidatus Saccharimonadales bacterium]|nr:hypothetical protein [Candidatus Saccharimonadales bacterium]